MLYISTCQAKNRHGKLKQNTNGRFPDASQLGENIWGSPLQEHEPLPNCLGTSAYAVRLQVAKCGFAILPDLQLQVVVSLKLPTYLRCK